MNKLKKIILILIIMLLLCFTVINKTYAVLGCNVGITSPTSSVEKGKEFDVYIKISNLQTTKGIIAIGATLEYDKNNLTFIDIEGQNKWSDPFYNEVNGKITSVKNKLSTNNENVLKIKFKAKDNAGTSAWVKISNFEISDGDEEKNVGGNSATISIKKIQNNTQEGDKKPEESNKPEESSKPDEEKKPGESNKPNDNTQNNGGGANKNKPTSTTNKGNTSNISNENKVENNIQNSVEENVENNNMQNTVDEDMELNNSTQNIFSDEVEKSEHTETKNQENKTKLIYALYVFGTIAIGIVIFYIVKYIKRKK